MSGRFTVDCAKKSTVASRTTRTKSPVHVSEHADNKNSNCSCTGRSITAFGGVLHLASSSPPHTYSSAKVIQRRRRASSKSAHLYTRVDPWSQNALLSSTSSSSTMPTATTPWWSSNWEMTAGTASGPLPTVRVSGSSGTSPRSPPNPPTKPRPAAACAADARRDPVERKNGGAMSPRLRLSRGSTRPSPQRRAGGASRTANRNATCGRRDISPKTHTRVVAPCARRPRAREWAHA